ncbi:MAG: A24 family peptidase, partial [Acidimicrobiales bacterium]
MARGRTVSFLHSYGPLLMTAPVLVMIADVDRRTQRIPDRLSLIALAVSAVSITIFTIDGGHSNDAASAGIGALLLTLILGALHMVRPDGLGMGDVKLAITLGLLLGWT